MTLQNNITPAAAKALYEYLQRHANGKANARRAQQLMREMNLGANGDRWLRAAVNVAAQNGLLICTGNEGYFIPASFEELEETMQRMSSQIAQMSKRLALMRQLAQRQFHFQIPTRQPAPTPEGQLRIFWDVG